MANLAGMSLGEHPSISAAALARADWTYLGWQGWGLFCPASWNPVILSAMRRSGSVVLADLDSRRLELTWRSRPKRKRVDLARTIDEVAASLTGRIDRHDLRRREQQQFQSSELIYSRGEQVAAVALASEVTQRAVVLRFWLAGVKKPLETARAVIGSLRDYRADAPSPWALYDLAFWLPAKFRLTDRRILAGSTRLAFAGPGAVLSFSKVAAAAAAADQSDPVEWFARSHRKDRRWYHYQQLQQAVGQHEATLTAGRLPRYRWGGQWYRRELLALCWACQTSERMFEVQTTGWRLKMELLQEAADGLVCHLPK